MGKRRDEDEIAEHKWLLSSFPHRVVGPSHDLTISRSHATALFVYSDSDYASAVIGQHLVHVDGEDDVKMHGTSPDPRASFCTILTVHVCGMIWITEE